VKAIVIGAGVIGSAVKQALEAKGHEVVTVGRTSGRFHADITDRPSLVSLFKQLVPFDAVASAAGNVFAAPIEQTTDEQWLDSIRSKGLGQINIVRAGLPYIADGGSFTLVSGILSEEYIAAGAIYTTVNALVEGFVRGAAVELPRGIRINCVSPTVLTEATGYHAYFPGFATVDAREVGQAYLRAVMTPITGRIIKLHKTG
jgi:NAD(P)-dependent dehydrogenase (short-subunit alcohol dehydrogenase family)